MRMQCHQESSATQMLTFLRRIRVLAIAEESFMRRSSDDCKEISTSPKRKKAKGLMSKGIHSCVPSSKLRGILLNTLKGFKYSYNGKGKLDWDYLRSWKIDHASNVGIIHADPCFGSRNEACFDYVLTDSTRELKDFKLPYDYDISMRDVKTSEAYTLRKSFRYNQNQRRQRGLERCCFRADCILRVCQCR